MLFKARVLERIGRGEVTLAFRRWTKPTVKAGGTLRTAAGVLAIDSVEPVELAALSEADIRAAGYASREALEGDLRPAGDLYRIAFHLVGEDPRENLRENDTLDAADIAALKTHLEKLDRTSPWTGLVLSMIVEKESRTAAEMAGRLNLLKLAPLLEDIHERLAGVVIECLSWHTFIARYDRPGMLFYLDPPYWGNEADYGPGVFGRSDFHEMAEVLGGLKGTFILSVNAVQGIFETFSGFNIEEVDCMYSIQGKGQNKAVREVIISPRPLAPR